MIHSIPKTPLGEGLFISYDGENFLITGEDGSAISLDMIAMCRIDALRRTVAEMTEKGETDCRGTVEAPYEIDDSIFMID